MNAPASDDDGDEDWLEEVEKAAKAVSDRLDADILLLAGGIDRHADLDVVGQVRDSRSRKNVLLMLTTSGGSADSAFRIARCLQNNYKDGRFLLFVDTICKSAGTIIAVGADEIVMSETAELGPLDVQVFKADEGQYSSGLTPIQTLGILRRETFTLFKDHFEQLKSELDFSHKMAAQVACRTVIGLFRPLYEQIDPMRLGEIERAMMIGFEYGKRLQRQSYADNGGLVDKGGLDQLVADYPSHGFVIDRSEAASVFPCVRDAEEDELLLCKLLRGIVLDGMRKDAKQLPANVMFVTRKEGKGDSSGKGCEDDEGEPSGASEPSEDGQGGNAPNAAGQPESGGADGGSIGAGPEEAGQG